MPIRGMRHQFINAEDAFIYYYKMLNEAGRKKDGTKFMNNIGFYLNKPTDNTIHVPERKWSLDYAETEFNWYLQGNPDVSELKKKAKIWDKMHNGDNIVNSNYGYQWKRNGQFEFVISELKRNHDTRRAVITIYDGKEHLKYLKDTPCTLNIVFNRIDDKLNMSVMMRSNDLWLGFCNDQYCFSKLQEIVANELQCEVGWYYHFANDLHIYEKHWNRF